jgi:hypothetical protein
VTEALVCNIGRSIEAKLDVAGKEPGIVETYLPPWIAICMGIDILLSLFIPNIGLESKGLFARTTH